MSFSQKLQRQWNVSTNLPSRRCCEIVSVFGHHSSEEVESAKLQNHCRSGTAGQGQSKCPDNERTNAQRHQQAVFFRNVLQPKLIVLRHRSRRLHCNLHARRSCSSVNHGIGTGTYHLCWAQTAPHPWPQQRSFIARLRQFTLPWHNCFLSFLICQFRRRFVKATNEFIRPCDLFRFFIESTLQLWITSPEIRTSAVMFEIYC